MSLDGQRIQPDRYRVVPRTLAFLLHGEELLLFRVSAGRGAWSGLLNGIGGHIEQGEDPLTSAFREIREETGLVPPDLRLCGVVVVDVGDDPGIGLYVFVGLTDGKTATGGREGEPVWVHPAQLHKSELVQDLPALIPRALASYRGGVPFSGLYTYDASGSLTTRFFP